LLAGKRKPISPKVRFEVFKRDSFRCQYCGRSAPDVILEVDHIQPVKEGGTNDLMNLITSCRECNQGKKDRVLDDKSMLEKQKKQLEELNERRLQLEMMLKWREELLRMEEETISKLSQKWTQLTGGRYGLNQNGLKTLRKIVKRFGVSEVLESMDIAAEQYFVTDEKGVITHESAEEAFNKISGICANRKKFREKPYLKDLHYIRGIARNKCPYYFDDDLALSLLEKAYLCGASIESLKEFTLSIRNWTQFREGLEQFIEAHDQHP